MDKVSYALGIGIGRQLASMGAESLNIDAHHAIGNELEYGDNNIIVVDNGSPSFQPFLSYFQVNVVEAFKSIRSILGVIYCNVLVRRDFRVFISLWDS